MQKLSAAGIPVTVMTAPIIPALNDMELERLLEAGPRRRRARGGLCAATSTAEVAPIFREWLIANYPDRYSHVMSVMQSMRGGKDYKSEWGVRQSGRGPYAWMIGRRLSWRRSSSASTPSGASCATICSRRRWRWADS